jgi:hypothetical protein
MNAHLAFVETARASVGLALVVPVGRAMRLSWPRGSRMTVGAGRVWVTQSGHADDRFLGAGETIDVVGDGVLVLESDGTEPALIYLGRVGSAARPARTGVARRWLDALLAARREPLRSHALSGLDDRMLRDIAIPAEVRRAIADDRDRTL